MKNNQCIFCSPQRKYIIAENENAIATYFVRAIKKGHFVVAVREHIPTLTGLTTKQLCDISELMLQVSKIVESELDAEKMYVAAIGDKDHHFHYHIYPKLKSDTPMGKHIMLNQGWKGEIFTEQSEDEVINFVELIKEKISINE